MHISQGTRALFSPTVAFHLLCGSRWHPQIPQAVFVDLQPNAYVAASPSSPRIQRLLAPQLSSSPDKRVQAASMPEKEDPGERRGENKMG